MGGRHTPVAPTHMATQRGAMKTGSLFSGYGGLDLAAISALDADIVWHSDNDTAAAKVLAHHWPGVPNLGDITIIDWHAVEPVDMLIGGFPCQDVSTAGRGLGIRPSTRSGLWSHMAYAIGQLRPEVVIIENVRGLLSAPASCDMEPCPWFRFHSGCGETPRSASHRCGDRGALLRDHGASPAAGCSSVSIGG